MSHSLGRGGAVPILFARGDPDDVAGPDFFFRTLLGLHPTVAGRDNERLAKWVRVPCGARAGLERDERAANARRDRALKWLLNAHRTGKVFCWALAKGL